MSRFNLDDYEPVDARIEKFWADHPLGRIVTTERPAPEGQWVVRTELYREGETEPYATGLAQETVGEGNVNRTSALENCETSSIGRALANAGYSPKGRRASREEMQKVERQSRPTLAPGDVRAALNRRLDSIPGDKAEALLAWLRRNGVDSIDVLPTGWVDRVSELLDKAEANRD